MNQAVEHVDGAGRAPNPIPETPTHCRGKHCGAVLDPLRRYAGLCRQCVARHQRPGPAPTRQLKSVYRVLRRFSRKRRDGKFVRYVELRCGGTHGAKCGRTTTIQASTWKHRRPRACAACTLREISVHGFPRWGD
jgi:hypothetical protein